MKKHGSMFVALALVGWVSLAWSTSSRAEPDPGEATGTGESSPSEDASQSSGSSGTASTSSSEQSADGSAEDSTCEHAEPQRFAEEVRSLEEAFDGLPPSDKEKAGNEIEKFSQAGKAIVKGQFENEVGTASKVEVSQLDEEEAAPIPTEAIPIRNCDGLVCQRAIPHHGGSAAIIFGRRPDGDYRIVGTFTVDTGKGGGRPDSDFKDGETMRAEMEAVTSAWQSAAESLFEGYCLPDVSARIDR